MNPKKRPTNRRRIVHNSDKDAILKYCGLKKKKKILQPIVPVKHHEDTAHDDKVSDEMSSKKCTLRCCLSAMLSVRQVSAVPVASDGCDCLCRALSGAESTPKTEIQAPSLPSRP